MLGIFINYRRHDAAGHAGRIYDRLRSELPRARIFRDVVAIGPGKDFVREIDSALTASDVFLAVVGPNWLRAKNLQGERRLDDPEDLVRRELATALERPDVDVIPVLVGGADMPSADQLPAELAAFARRNAVVLSEVGWDDDIERLVRALRHREEGDEADLRPVIAGVAGAAMLVAATALRLDGLVDPDFGGGTVPGLGAVIAPASIMIPLGALYALLKAWLNGAGPLATGLLLGFALGGLAKYSALLGQRATSNQPERLDSTGSLLLGLAGSAVIAGVATFWLVTSHRQTGPPSRVAGRFLALAGAGLIAAATLIPFNVSLPETSHAQQVILQRSFWEAFEPLLLAGVVVLAVFVGRTMKQRVVSGFFTAVGLLAALSWLRYVGVPVLQMVQEDNLASVRAAGFIAIAGSVLVWFAGMAARRERVRG
jgi:hypothetical protein